MSIDGLLEALTQVRKWLLRSGVLNLGKSFLPLGEFWVVSYFDFFMAETRKKIIMNFMSFLCISAALR